MCVCRCEEKRNRERREHSRQDGEIDCQLSLGSSLLRAELRALHLLYYSYRELFCAISRSGITMILTKSPNTTPTAPQQLHHALFPRARIRTLRGIDHRAPNGPFEPVGRSRNMMGMFIVRPAYFLSPCQSAKFGVLEVEMSLVPELRACSRCMQQTHSGSSQECRKATKAEDRS